VRRFAAQMPPESHMPDDAFGTHARRLRLSREPRQIFCLSLRDKRFVGVARLHRNGSSESHDCIVIVTGPENASFQRVRYTLTISGLSHIDLGGTPSMT